MIIRQLFILVLSLAVSLIIVGAALSQDQQKRQGRQQSQQICPPARSAPAIPAPAFQQSRPPAQTMRLPVTQPPRSLPPQIHTQPQRSQPTPPARVYQPQRPSTLQVSPPQAPRVQPPPGQPVSPLSKPPEASSLQHVINTQRPPQPEKTLLPRHPRGTPGPQPPDKLPYKERPPHGLKAHHGWATPSSPWKQGTGIVTPPPPSKKIEPHVRRGHTPTVEDKSPIRKPTRTTLGEVAPGKHQEPRPIAPVIPLEKEKASVGKQQKPDAPKSQAKLEDMSRKELRDALARESGEKSGDRYYRMSKNELVKELEGVRAKKSSPTPAVKNENLGASGTPTSTTPAPAPVAASPSAPAPSPSSVNPVTKLNKDQIQEIWKTRPDVNDNVHAKKGDPYEKTQMWWDKYGRKEMGNYQFSGTSAATSASAPAPSTSATVNPVKKLSNEQIQEIWKTRPDVNDNVHAKKGGDPYEKTQNWWDNYGRKEMGSYQFGGNSPPTTPAAPATASSSGPMPSSSTSTAINPVKKLSKEQVQEIWKTRPDVNDNVHAKKGDPYEKTQRWWDNYGRKEMGSHQFTATPTSEPPEEKYKRNPKLANVKWSDNELRKHIKDNLDDLGKKYDKKKYENMSRKDLEQAYHEIHSKAEKKEKKDKSDKHGSGDKYEKLLRNELEKAIEKELGHKLDKKYDNMSKNELLKELASLKEKDKDKHKKTDKSEPGDKYEKLSRNELEKAIEKELGHKLDKKYDKMSKNELRNELANLKERNHRPASQSQPTSHNQQPGQSGGGTQSKAGTQVSSSNQGSGGADLKSFKGVLGEKYGSAYKLTGGGYDKINFDGPWKLPRYGHYGGPGYGSGDPMDDLDRCFQKHDNNYTSATKPMDIIKADLALIKDMWKVDTSKCKKPAYAEEYRLGATALFYEKIKIEQGLLSLSKDNKSGGKSW